MSRVEILFELLQWTFIITTFMRVNFVASCLNQMLKGMTKFLEGLRRKEEDGTKSTGNEEVSQGDSGSNA